MISSEFGALTIQKVTPSRRHYMPEATDHSRTVKLPPSQAERDAESSGRSLYLAMLTGSSRTLNIIHWLSGALK